MRGRKGENPSRRVADRPFAYLQIIDLRLVRRRNGTWKLLVEGVEHSWSIGGMRIATYLVKHLLRREMPWPMRLCNAIYHRKPDGHP